MKRIFTAALILLSTAFISLTCNNAYAALCTLTSPLATLNIMDDITLNVIKQREVGKVLWSKTYQVPDVSYTCDASTQSSWHSSYSRSYIRSQIDHVYNTEIPGIGIRMRWPTQTESSWLPGNSGSPTTCSTGCGVKNSTVLVEMVQTGSMPEGEYFIPAGKVAEALVIPSADESEKLPIMAINFGVAIKVVTASCSIYPSATNVDLGTYNIADFQNDDTFQGVKKDFSITVGCPSTEQIGITFNSLINTPLGALTGVIGVESGDGYASNFSIRLFEKNSTAITLGKEKVYTASTLTKNYQAHIYVGGGVDRKTALTPGKVVGAVQYTVVIK
ncbi:fimbrial protein [Enterobacter kobei]|uniref:fimbrial protein n=1 Tax=Enterobacter kobei TaxID=208224 RepID=UPI00125241DD|nr:fimbrial protein [Enterobacter kobei]ELJ5854300.1 type 1 fimbrial protein [Enterobacter kobei]VAL63107.1 fimbria adhesin protein [Enterobacter kobei]